MYVYNDKLAYLAEVQFLVREVPGSPPTDTSTLHTLFYIPVCILSSKTHNFGKDSQPKLSNDCYLSLTLDAAGSRVLHLEN